MEEESTMSVPTRYVLALVCIGLALIPLGAHGAQLTSEKGFTTLFNGKT
jgi:hypothetical protein